MKTLVNNMGLKGIRAYAARTIQRSGAYTRKEFETFISQTESEKFVINESNIGFSIFLKRQL